MHQLVRTAAVAIASSLTTAALLGACTLESPGRGASPSSVEPASPTGGPNTAVADAPSQMPVQARGAQAQVASARAQTPPPQASTLSPAAAVYQKASESVVNITSLAVVRARGGQQLQQPQGVGSGFIIDTDGRIVTNNHVVQDAEQLTVTFKDRTTVPAKLLGRDEPNDLAVVQVDPGATDDQGRSIRDRIKPVTLGNSEAVSIGEYVVAIGSPLGLQQTVTMGIVSALRNPGEEAARGNLDLLSGAIQTDASINPGNSGGPLFNASGDVIGVNTAILSQSGGNEGIGFAIPVNVVTRVAPELIQTGRYRHPLMGITSISLSQLSPNAKRQLGLRETQRGLLVLESSAGAAQAGVRGGNRRVTIGAEALAAGGDIIIALDGKPVATSGELRGYIENSKRPGDSIAVTLLRDGQQLELVVTLTERPAESR